MFLLIQLIISWKISLWNLCFVSHIPAVAVTQQSLFKHTNIFLFCNALIFCRTPCAPFYQSQFHSRLHTQARSIIQISDEQNSQYVGMLYCVDLNMWPLCSSTCREQRHNGSYGFYLHTSVNIYIYVTECSFWCVSILLNRGEKSGTYNIGVLLPPFFNFRFSYLLFHKEKTFMCNTQKRFYRFIIINKTHLKLKKIN